MLFEFKHILSFVWQIIQLIKTDKKSYMKLKNYKYVHKAWTIREMQNLIKAPILNHMHTPM